MPATAKRCKKVFEPMFKATPILNRPPNHEEAVHPIRKDVFVQPIELAQLAHVPVTLDRITDRPVGCESDLPSVLSGQKKRTSSGRTRRRPSLLTCSISARPLSRSERGNSVPLIRYGQSLTTLGSPTLEHVAASLAGHASPESVRIRPLAAGRLEGPFHARCRLLIFFRFTGSCLPCSGAET